MLAAAVLSEMGVFAAMLAAIGISMLATAGPVDGEQVGYYVAPTAGAVMTFLVVAWMARPLPSGFIRFGLLVGIAEVVLTFGFIFGARPEHRLMYGVSFGLRILGGYAGGLVAQRRFSARVAGHNARNVVRT